MIMITMILVATLAGCGVYNMLCGLKDIPSRKASRLMLQTKRDPGSQKLFEVYLTKMAAYLTPLIKLDPVKRGRLESALLIAKNPLTPEIYTAKAYVTALIISWAAVPFFFVAPLLSFLILGLAVVMWFAIYQQVFDYVKKRKTLIETELPRFAVSIAQSLENDRDVLKLLTLYRRIAGPNLAQELDTTIADMKTGNYENALLRFQNRIGSTMLSDIVRGLIGTLRGDDQQMYFKMLTFDMRQLEQNNLKKEAAKRPKKMVKYSMMMLFCILLIYVVVLSVEVAGSLTSFF